MFAKSLVIAYIQIYIVTVLRANTYITHFQVFITEHFFYGRQTVGFFIREFYLQ